MEVLSMRKTILRRRERESFEIPPLPVRLSGQDLRGGLARFRPPATIRLGPGERIIGGRVLYSAAWLDAPDLSHLVGLEPGKEDTITTYEIRTRFNLEPESGDALGPEYTSSPARCAGR
jgi:hypothetical protein